MKMLSLLLMLACLTPLVCRAQTSPSPARTRGPAADYAFETGDLMRHTAWRNVPALNKDEAPDGAYGPVNRAWDLAHAGPWYIEEQRYAADTVSGGIAAGDTGAIDRGLRALAWGWKQQQPDGSFACPDHFHSASFFIEASAHACLMLQGSPYAARYAAQVADMKPRLLRAARWMTLPAVEAEGRRKNAKFTHRRYLVADALGETGVLCGGDALVRKSQEYVRDGIALQDPSGFNPERGGYDTSYHAFGVFLAERYYVLVAADALRPPLYAMLRKANAWEASRLNPDGTINAAGNTRTGAEQEKNRTGAYKKAGVGEVFRCFGYWAVLSGDTAYQDLAVKVAKAGHMFHAPVSAAHT